MACLLFFISIGVLPRGVAFWLESRGPVSGSWTATALMTCSTAPSRAGESQAQWPAQPTLLNNTVYEIKGAEWAGMEADLPRVVDHDERRREIAAAMWRIILRDGMGAVTVRALAAEAGRSVGAVRHYYKSQDDLILFSVGEMLVSIARRMATLDLRDPAGPALQQFIEEMLPLNPQRKAEAQVWFALLTRRVASPEVATRANDLDLVVRNAIQQVLIRLRVAGLLAGDRDLDIEAVRLHALIDGLALHGISEPPLDSASKIQAAIRTHIADLIR
jgi:AcrR family transcriptional regulator